MLINNKIKDILVLYTPTLYILLLLISNIIATKIIILPFDITITSACLLYTFLYVLDDVITNCYGFEFSKNLTICTSIFNIIMIIIFYIAIKLPAVDADFNICFKNVLGTSIRLVIASIVSYIIGSIINSYLLQYIKSKQNSINKSKNIVLRTYISSIPSHVIDTFLFIFFSFYNFTNLTFCIRLFLYQCLFKLIFELLLQPITLFFIKKFVSLTNLNVIDVY